MSRSQSTEEELEKRLDSEPYNAANPEHVARRAKGAKSGTELQRDGLRELMATRQGRAWMAHLLTDKLFTRLGSRRPPAMFTGNSGTFYNAALRELGDVIATELSVIAPADFRKMEDELNG